MKKSKKILLAVFCGVGLLIGLVIGVMHYGYCDNCTGPFRQSNGCDHYVCVGDDGHRYCKECCANQACSVISCQ